LVTIIIIIIIVIVIITIIIISIITMEQLRDQRLVRMFGGHFFVAGGDLYLTGCELAWLSSSSSSSSSSLPLLSIDHHR
jgi:hypothetical protein